MQKKIRGTLSRCCDFTPQKRERERERERERGRDRDRETEKARSNQKFV